MLVRVTREIDDENSRSSVVLTQNVIYRIRPLTKDEQKYIKPFNNGTNHKNGYIWNLIIEREGGIGNPLYLMSSEFREWIKDGTMVIVNES